MSEPVSNATILIDVVASDPGDISPSLIDLLGPHKVVVLGYYPVPDQSSAGQLRKEFSADATAAVERIADQFSAHGASVESTVVFTHDRDKTITSTADEYDVDAVLTAGTIGERLESVLVRCAASRRSSTSSSSSARSSARATRTSRCSTSRRARTRPQPASSCSVASVTGWSTRD